MKEIRKVSKRYIKKEKRCLLHHSKLFSLLTFQVGKVNMSRRSQSAASQGFLHDLDAVFAKILLEITFSESDASRGDALPKTRRPAQPAQALV